MLAGSDAEERCVIIVIGLLLLIIAAAFGINFIWGLSV
jgi:hypothetical protein